MFSTTETALALGVTQKRLDNMLVGPCRELISVGRNGRARSISPDVVEKLAVIVLLERDLGLSATRALDLANRLLASDEGAVSLGALCSLRFDVKRLRSVLRNALSDAVEGHQRPRRGRPTQGIKKKRGASL